MTDQKNLLLAVLASLVILLAWHFFYEAPRLERERAELARQQTTTAVPGAAPGEVELPEAGAPGAAPAPQTREEALATVPRVRIETPNLDGSIALKGGLVDDLRLVQYRKTVDPKSPEIVLLSPRGMREPYYVQTGWVGANGPALPGPDTVWTADRNVLTPKAPVTLRWDNGQGLVFERRFAVDEHFLFTVTDRVINKTGDTVTLYPYALASRTGTPKTLGFFILHEGALGVVNDKLEEFKYEDLKEDGPFEVESEAGGWVGFTDHYWLVALIPDGEGKERMRMLYLGRDGKDRYQVDVRGKALAVPASGEASATNRIFAGAKVVELLDRYGNEQHINRFDLAVDFGWFYFLTKPIFHVLVYFAKILGNFGLAILLLTVLIKLAFFPLANRSYRAMSAMKRLQPKMMELRERYKDDKMRLNQELMELYKREKVNPASGCLPIIIQIPVFFALYKVLFVTIEMRHAPFYGWISDLSAPDPTSWINAFGLLPWSVPDLGFLNFLNIGAWPLIMGTTMVLQQKLSPQPADPVQARLFMIMPIVFTFLLGHFAAGLVIYWAWNNVLSILQQWIIMRREGVSP